tara:strand:+ start:362 stop:469 length:108 start_codon:yes stop_codon:yes gene_type:complete
MATSAGQIDQVFTISLPEKSRCKRKLNIASGMIES